MSTRCVVNFCSEYEGKRVVEAKIYRHSDGYPDTKHGVLADLERFFADVEEQTDGDTRFGDPSYLAAKFVVWQALGTAASSAEIFGKEAKPLNFLGVGVLRANPGDIEHEYFVVSGAGSVRPKVVHKKVRSR